MILNRIVLEEKLGKTATVAKVIKRAVFLIGEKCFYRTVTGSNGRISSAIHFHKEDLVKAQKEYIKVMRKDFVDANKKFLEIMEGL